MSEPATIAALATAPGPAGIAVIRASGPGCREVLRTLFVSEQSPITHPRTLVLGSIMGDRGRRVIDQGLAVFMPAPASYTGEDVLEFQCHGSPALVQQILRALFEVGVSPAEPGEFTRRAFLNGKIDLIQAEAVCDLISATTDEAARVAREQLEGRFSETVATIGEPLRDVLAEFEAGIDFAEEDIEPTHLAELREHLARAEEGIQRLLRSYSYGQIVKEGFRVLLCGRPNVGKSSLLNLLLGHERAIVTEVSGTTRDLIEEEAVLSGYRFIFCDSAGITESSDAVERIGIELARERIGWADLVLFLVDATDRTEEWRRVLPALQGRSREVWMVVNKIDLSPGSIGAIYCDSTVCTRNFYLSAKTGSGIDSLTGALTERVTASSGHRGETSGVLTNERQRSCLVRALEALGRCREVLDQHLPEELAVAELRGGLGALDEIIGRTCTEDILGRIFSRFCIGK